MKGHCMDPTYGIPSLFSDETTVLQIKFSDLHLFLTGYCHMFLQLRSSESVGGFPSNFLLCPLMIAFMLREQLFKILM